MTQQITLKLTNEQIRDMPDSVTGPLLRAFNKRKARRKKTPLAKGDMEFLGEVSIQVGESLGGPLMVYSYTWCLDTAIRKLSQVEEASETARQVLGGDADLFEHLYVSQMGLTHAPREGIKPSSVYVSLPKSVQSQLVE
tara:strand:- start:51019 stop:51435 length:417 start_codon:yes stop_codon:yes gene_type:complete